MGMYDDVRCSYALPVKGFKGRTFQTKSFQDPFLDLYEIRQDGTLWREHYDIEDRSDPKAEGLMALAGSMTRINQRWEPEPFTGSLRFYTFHDEKTNEGWIEFNALFQGGKLLKLTLRGVSPSTSESKLLFRLVLPGQLPPGKSQQGRRKDGSTYPKAERFVTWVKNSKTLCPYPSKFFDVPMHIRVRYVPGDLRSRNAAGMLDAIMHYLENGKKAPRNKAMREAWKQRARWIRDDELIWDVTWRKQPVDRVNPMAEIELWTMGAWQGPP